VRGETARFTSLDSCCAPVTKACGKVTTTGFISVKLTQEIEAGTVVKVKSANDKICVYDPGCDVLLDLQAEIVLCQVNPDLVGLITGQEVVLDYAGNAVGFRRSTEAPCDLRWALEVWTDVPGTACVGTPPAKQFGYFLVPCLRNATLSGDITIDNANAVSLTLTAKTTVPSLWGTGPATADGAYQVVPTDALNTPGYLLTPIGSADHDHIQLTTIAPPVVPENCGCEAITITGTDLTPVISALEPNSGLPAAGDTNIEMTGAHLTGATAVTVGVTAATGIVVVDDSHLVFTTPAKVAGTYTVTVTTPEGTSAAFSGLTFV
jgi:hypothetical protein